MKKFCRNIFYVLVILLLFNAVVFVFANDNYYKGYNEFPDKDFHSFILADSHGMPLGKFPEKFGVYNFSSNSDSYEDMERKISYLLDNGYNVKTIYITADDHTLSPYRDDINNMDKSIIYTSKMDFNFIKEKYVKYYFPLLQLKVNPLFRIYLEDKVKLLLNQKDKTANKIVWSELSENEQKKRAEERVMGQFPSKNKSIKLEKTLLDIVNLCQINQVELVGLKFPVSNSYLDKLNDHNYGADQMLKSNRIEVLDYSSVFRREDSYFGDQDHLNELGGEQFVNTAFRKQKTPLRK